MKWSLQQLYKYGNNPIPVKASYDFKKEIEDIDDILDITLANVSGTGINIGEDRFHFNLHISVLLYLQDAITLEAVEFPLELDITEEYNKFSDDDEARFIEKNTIELRDVIWENILLEKPIRFVKEEESQKP